MASQAITKPNAVTFSIEDVIGHVLEGRVRVPDVQGKLRWHWEDVRRLLDSIVRGYPIGTLLLWSRPAEAADLVLGALALRAPASDEALWVVDGQQRLISLANALNDAGQRDPRFAAAYDLAAGKLVEGSVSRTHVVPLPVVFDLQRLLRWFSENPESTQYFDEGTRVAKAIREYAVPAYVVKHQDESVLRDIFDRVNDHGHRLTRAEVFSALHTGQSAGGSTATVADIVEQIDVVSGFGELDEDTVLRADRHGGAALHRAVRFLQDEAFVPHFGFLSYRYLLVVLTQFFAHHPEPGPQNLDRQAPRRGLSRRAHQ